METFYIIKNKTIEPDDKDFKEFLYHFKLATSIIEVTKEENNKLSSFTSFTDNNYNIEEKSMIKDYT